MQSGIQNRDYHIIKARITEVHTDTDSFDNGTTRDTYYNTIFKLSDGQTRIYESSRLYKFARSNPAFYIGNTLYLIKVGDKEINNFFLCSAYELSAELAPYCTDVTQ